MDFVQRLQILIKSNSSGFRKDIQDIPKAVSDVVAKADAAAKKGGKEVGDSFGEGISKSTEKWMNLTKSVLRKHFGEFGRFFSDGLEYVEKYSKAIEETRKESAKLSKESGVDGSTLSPVVDYLAGRQGAKSGVKKSVNGDLEHIKKQLEHAPFGMRSGVIEGFKTGTLAEVVNASKVPPIIQPSVIAKARVAFLGLSTAMWGVVAGMAAVVVGAASYIRSFAKAREETEKLASSLGLTVNVFEKLKDDKEFISVFEKFGNKVFTVTEELGKLHSVSDRNVEVIKLFGKDGISTYEQLAEAVRKYKQAQSETNWLTEAFKNLMKDVGVNIPGYWDVMKTSIDNLTPGLVKTVLLLGKLGLVKATDALGVGPEAAKKAAGEAAAQMKKKAEFEEKRQKAAEKAIEEEKKFAELQKQVNSDIEKKLSIYQQIIIKEKELAQLQLIKKKSAQDELEILRLINELRNLPTGGTPTGGTPTGGTPTGGMPGNGQPRPLPTMKDLTSTVPGQALPEGMVGPPTAFKPTMAGTNPIGAGDLQEATRIKNIEEKAIPNALRLGRRDVASQLRQRANYGRNFLGRVRGVLDPSEYENRPVEGPYKNMLDRFLKATEKQRQSKEAVESILEYIKTGVPVKPINGK